MSRYLRTYLILVAVLIGAFAAGLWSVGAFDLNPRWRMGILLLSAMMIGGYTRLFWAGRRDDD